MTSPLRTLNINVESTSLPNFYCGLVLSFVVTGGRSWSFQTLNLEVFKTEQEKVFVLISITLCADSVATDASLDQILLCLNPFDAELISKKKFTILGTIKYTYFISHFSHITYI